MKPYYHHAGVTIYHGDCREVLPVLPSVRLVITDPPYTFGIASVSQGGKAGGWGDLMNSSVWYESWLIEAKRLTETQQGACWVFNSWRSLPVLARAAYAAQWPIGSLLVWDKGGLGTSGPGQLRTTYELVALFGQPQFAIADRSIPDVWREPKVPGAFGHPAAKPVPLLLRLIAASSGGSVLDPFMGSGSTLVAAKQSGFEAIGVEIEERYCEVAAQRLEQEILFSSEVPA